MTEVDAWWSSKMRTSILVDNDSWILPFAEKLVKLIRKQGHFCELKRTQNDLAEGDVCFFLGCTQIVREANLKKYRQNLVVHASDLPKGRGFSPLTWAILNGEHCLTVKLLEAAKDVDAGDIYETGLIQFEGHELLPELRRKLGDETVALCLSYLSSEKPPIGVKQQGSPTWLKRRTPEDSRLDPEKTILSQINLLRVVDNEAYPAFFELHGRRYILKIEASSEGETD